MRLRAVPDRVKVRLRTKPDPGYRDHTSEGFLTQTLLGPGHRCTPRLHLRDIPVLLRDLLIRGGQTLVLGAIIWGETLITEVGLLLELPRDILLTTTHS